MFQLLPFGVEIFLSDLGPKTFSFNNVWLDHPGFSEIVARSWGFGGSVGWMVVSLREKFKRLKFEMKRWNVEVFGFCLKRY